MMTKLFNIFRLADWISFFYVHFHVIPLNAQKSKFSSLSEMCLEALTFLKMSIHVAAPKMKTVLAGESRRFQVVVSLA